MRYTFNMVTMLKEKVNTHFSFPMRLDMSEYVEKHLMPTHYQGNFIGNFDGILFFPHLIVSFVNSWYFFLIYRGEEKIRNEKRK